MNLFKNNPQVANTQGWLYAQQVNDMSDAHAHQNEGFTNLVTILPHERQRPIRSSTSRKRHELAPIQQYGGYT